MAVGPTATTSDPVSLATQPDGKILATGYLPGVLGIGVVRYLPDGQIDSSFGSGGIGSISGPTFCGGTQVIAVQSDGKIVVGGGCSGPGELAIGRLNPDGTPDTTFGTNGLVVTTPPVAFGADAVLIQPDGDIVIGGWGWPHFYEGSLARYLPDGSLDTTFGRSGIAQFRRPAFSISRLANGPGGTILASITEQYKRYPGHTGTTLGVARFTDRGHLDSSFGQSGLALGAFDKRTSGQGLAVQSDGRIVVAGIYVTTCCLTRQRFAVSRFNPDGTVDTSFSADGSTTTTFGRCDSEFPRALAEGVSVQPNGKIVVVGTVTDATCTLSPYEQIAVVRYQPGGALDGTFGTGGRVTTATGEFAAGYDVAVLPRHRILVAGLGTNAQGTGLGILLAQYLAS